MSLVDPPRQATGMQSGHARAVAVEYTTLSRTHRPRCQRTRLADAGPSAGRDRAG
jgi:hypothetical protein